MEISKRFILKTKWSAYVPTLVFMVLYSASLSYGYLWDDFVELQSDLDHVLGRLKQHFRPVYYFSELFFNALFTEAYQHRTVNILLLAAAAYFAVRTSRNFGIPHSPLIVTAIFLHPTFVYPATWISQRNDGFLLFFLFLALFNFDRARGWVYLLLSDLSKTPWVFQNLWYAIRKWPERGNRWAIAAIVIVIPLIVGQGLLFWDEVQSSGNSPITKLSGGSVSAVFILPLIWVAKVVEAILLIHVPIPAFYGSVSGSILLVIGLIYLAAWVGIYVQAFRNLERNRASWHLLILALFMCVPFAANNDPRVFGPAIPFFYLFWASIGTRGKTRCMAFAIVATLNVAATALNYRISDTGIYHAPDAPDYTLCGVHEMQFPMERWRCDRSTITHEIVRRLNEAL